MILGLSGYAQSGKDTLGGILVEEHGFIRVSFADVLRSVLYAMNPMIPGEDAREPSRRVQDLVDALGWEAAKVLYSEVRSLLQRLGTEAGRGVLGENVWVNAALAAVPLGTEDNFVVTDVRFLNEALAIKDRGGLVYRIRRPGTAPVNPHVSETALDGYTFDGLIDNSGSIAYLREIARWLVRA